MADRPPFILAFAADQQGCGFHRIMMPLASLVEAGVADGRLDLAIWPDEAGLACKPDVVIWQRQVEDSQIEAMARWRKMLPNAIFIYELDDYLHDIPAISFHASFMPTDISGRISRALVHCDRITTTTEPMAHWLRTLAEPGCPIDVVPNALPVSRLRERKARTTGKLRVGFAGGISHSGDLRVLEHAMHTIGDAVTWVFFGMNMEDAPIDIEFHEGVPATMYLDKMLSLDLDLMLAPLQDNPFNRCKSNLRLVEAAAIGAAVIAQDLPPYHVLKPPVFAYALGSEGWTNAIRDFIAADRSKRQRSADELRTWAGRHYTLERLLPKRIEAWLPDDIKPWRPSVTTGSQFNGIVACSDAMDVNVRAPFLASCVKVTEGLEAACLAAVHADVDVLWLRPATTLNAAGYNRLRKLLRSNKEFASVVPLASDGTNGFPQLDRWTQLPPHAVAVIAGLATEQFGSRSVVINAPTGPVVCLSVRALSMIGLPDVAGCDGSEEQAIMEWGLRAATRGWKHGQSLGTFAGSTTPPIQPSQQAALRIQARGLGEQLGNITPESLLLPAERASLERRLLQSQWGGPRPGSMGFANDYETWKLLSKAQEPNVDDIILLCKPPIYTQLFGVFAGDVATAYPDDSWIIFWDENSSVAASAEYWFEQALAQNPDNKFLVMYGDSDTVIGGKVSPEFKPDFDPTLLLAQDYVTPVCAVASSLVRAIGVPNNRTELFSIVLQAYAAHGVKAFHHIPRILGAIILNSTPETTALETLERQLIVEKVFGAGVKVTASRQIMGCLTVTREWKAWVDKAPLVSIIVPTLGSGRLIQPCVATILQHTAYSNYEIIVVQNGHQRTEPELSMAILANSHVRVVHYDEDDAEFNWSKINNWAIKVHAKGEYIVTMNDDVCVASKQWLDLLMGHAVMPGIGVVGAKLLHPMGVVQHVGVVCHNGIAGHMHKGMTGNQAGHLGRALLSHEARAVTGACMLFSRKVFDEIGGFDASLSTNYNDTVFCVKLHERGYRNVVETSAELMHPEASTRADSRSLVGSKVLVRDNVSLAALCPGPDPYWNPNMAIAADGSGLAIQGLNADILAWTDFTPQLKSQRILLVNDRPGAEGCILDVLKTGAVPFLADLSGFSLRLIAPTPLNMQPWDIRDQERLTAELAELGINQIVLRSLVGAEGAAPPVEALRIFKWLDIPVIVQPFDLTLIAPWLVKDGRTNEARLFGYVDVAAWQAAYEALAGEA